MEPGSPSPATKPPSLSRRYARLFLGGAAYGMLMRWVFGFAPWFVSKASDGAKGVMLCSFVVLVPALIGAASVYGLPPAERRWTRALIVPWIPVLLFISGTAVLLIEGLICIVLALPLFLFTASLGGLAMWLILRYVPVSRGTMGAALALPLALGLAERNLALPDASASVDSSIHIAAPAAEIWQLINRATDIAPGEMDSGWAWRIGVPHPVSAITSADGGPRVRRLRWEKGVHFDEPILDWDENRYIRWRYKFADDSIPSGALDEHVTIGGRYFDLVDTSYRLEAEGDGTRLTIHVTYRVSTRFNWYAQPLAHVLIGNAADTILAFYRNRCEAPHTRSASAAAVL